MRSRKRILDATLELIGRDTFEGISIAAVAQQAGVTRQTVYSNFGSREELVSEALGDLVVRVLEDIRFRLDEAENPVDYVVELIVSGRATLRSHHVLTTLFNVEPGNPLFDPGMVTRARPIARELLAPLEKWEDELKARLDDIVDITLMLALAVTFFEDDTHRTDADLRSFLTRWLRPAMLPN